MTGRRDDGADPDGPGGRDVLLSALDVIAGSLAGLDWQGGRPRPLALGWATVELERAVAEFAASRVGTGTFGPTAPDRILGAACREAGIAGSGIRLVVCEPATEGRLAASLARSGEGPAAGWFESHGTSGRAGLTVSAEADGPFGPEVVVLGSPLAGPHILLVRPSSALP